MLLSQLVPTSHFPPAVSTSPSASLSQASLNCKLECPGWLFLNCQLKWNSLGPYLIICVVLIIETSLWTSWWGLITLTMTWLYYLRIGKKEPVKVKITKVCLVFLGRKIPDSYLIFCPFEIPFEGPYSISFIMKSDAGSKINVDNKGCCWTELQ